MSQETFLEVLELVDDLALLPNTALEAAPRELATARDALQVLAEKLGVYGPDGQRLP